MTPTSIDVAFLATPEERAMFEATFISNSAPPGANIFARDPFLPEIYLLFATDDAWRVWLLGRACRKALLSDADRLNAIDANNWCVRTVHEMAENGYDYRLCGFMVGNHGPQCKTIREAIDAARDQLLVATMQKKPEAG